MFIKFFNESNNHELAINPTNNGYDVDSMYMILNEASERWNSLTQSVANIEVQLFLENDENGFLLLEGELIDSVKEYFKDLFAKIKELFNALSTWLQAAVLTDKKFIEKYRSQLNNIRNSVPSSFTYSLVDIRLNLIHNTLEKGTNELIKEAESIMSNKFKKIADSYVKNKVDSEKSNFGNIMRAKYFDGKENVDSSDFSSELLSSFCRGKDSDKNEMTRDEISADNGWQNLIDIVASYDKTIRIFKANKDKISNLFNKIINSANKVSETIGSRNKDSDSYSSDKKEINSIKKVPNAYDKKGSSNHKLKTDLLEKSQSEIASRNANSSNQSFAKASYEISANYTANLRTISSIALTAYGEAIKALRKAHTQARGCLNKALVKSALNKSGDNSED